MEKIIKKKIPLPENFHTILKFEAITNGKTITKYCSDVANEVIERKMSLRQYFNRSENEKKKFVPRF